MTDYVIFGEKKRMLPRIDMEPERSVFPFPRGRNQNRACTWHTVGQNLKVSPPQSGQTGTSGAVRGRVQDGSGELFSGFPVGRRAQASGGAP